MAWWDPPAHKRMPTISGVKGAQIETEIAEFVQLLQEHGVTSYLEIGGKFGDTFGRVMMALPEDAVGVLVDLPPNDRRQGMLRETFNKIKACRPNVHLLLGNSHDQDIIEEVRSHGPYGACLIDGDRTYEGIEADFLNFGPMCGITAFHDIRAAGLHLAEAVKGQPYLVSGLPDMMAPVLWHEIQHAGFRTREIADPDEYVGIGVVFNDRKVYPE